jgi:hypothetical protein
LVKGCINCRAIFNNVENKRGVNRLKEFDQLPKSIKKTVRYIKQDATNDQLEIIRKIINITIDKRKSEQNIPMNT